MWAPALLLEPDGQQRKEHLEMKLESTMGSIPCKAQTGGQLRFDSWGVGSLSEQEKDRLGVLILKGHFGCWVGVGGRSTSVV